MRVHAHLDSEMTSRVKDNTTLLEYLFGDCMKY